MAIFVDLEEEPSQAPAVRFPNVIQHEIYRDINQLRITPNIEQEQPKPKARSPSPTVPQDTQESLEELYSALNSEPEVQLPAAIRAFACYPEELRAQGALDHETGPYGFKTNYCARDMVSECRRCGCVVCRNCVIKPPATPAFKGRHRRLCLDCTKAPLTSLFVPPMDEKLANREIVNHAMCTCQDEGVWLCKSCGQGNNSADSLYHRLWSWRLQYGEIIGGLGTGIGDGDRGVICGRESRCIGAKEREYEIDCDAEDRRTPSPTISGSGSGSGSGSSSPQLGLSHAITTLDSASAQLQLQVPTARKEPGYSRHQIEGIGGQLQTKLVRMVRVGASVPEWSDERSSRAILAKEIKGETRSWCGWCCRPIPGEKDRAAFGVGQK
ncbi:sulfate transporter protein [Ceratocystis lukuohia]|uniref:Sulfate transporter protein n=1 Tax=Ceratocystis lukuohia TaxID=2019550 RepID=A0ABR4MKR3_9PEZI